MPTPDEINQWIQQQVEGTYEGNPSREAVGAELIRQYPRYGDQIGSYLASKRTWPQTIAREAQLGAEQFVRGVPSIIAAPGNINQLANQLWGVPQASFLPTSETINRVVTGAERGMGIEPIVPQTPWERGGAAVAQGIGGGLVPVGGGLGVASRIAAGAAGGGAAQATRELAPQLGPLAPVLAGTLAGGAVGTVGARVQGARTYSDIMNDPTYAPPGSTGVTPVKTGVIPPGMSRTDAGEALQNKLAHDVMDPSGVPGLRGVPNTDLSIDQVNRFTNYKDPRRALNEVQKDNQLAADFQKFREPVLKQGGGAILSLNADKHIPSMARSGTLETVFGPEDANVLRNQYMQPSLMVQEESALKRAVLSERNIAVAGGILSAAGAVAGHVDPGVGAALTLTMSALPYVPRAAGWLRANFPGAMPGGTTGIVTGLPNQGLPSSYLQQP